MNIKVLIIKKHAQLLLMLLTGWVLSGCSGLQVMIETEHPEDDFVVVCSWSSDFLKLHGGASRIKENVFVASSDEVVDCGTSWRGDGPVVVVRHPLYRGTIGGQHESGYKSKAGYQKGDVYVMTPKSKQQYLDELISKYEGKVLANAARDYLAGNFPSQYLSHYNSVKKIKPGHFKKMYEERLTKYWEKLLPIIQDEFTNEKLRNYTVKDFVDKYWKKVKAYE
jgi:hypothetical protein